MQCLIRVYTVAKCFIKNEIKQTPLELEIRLLQSAGLEESTRQEWV